MTDREKVTIVVAWFNLVEDKLATTESVDQLIRQKTVAQLEWMRDHMLKTYTNDQMILAAEKFSGTKVY